jgi:hypothetical protein
METKEKMQRIETLPKFRGAVKSMHKELGNSFNKHATKTNLVRHMPKHDREFAKDVVAVFIKLGLLRKHRSDTFSWTAEGLEYAKNILRGIPLKGAQKVLVGVGREFALPHLFFFKISRIPELSIAPYLIG